jgi:two-component system KDP operon response regulator KdpE
MAGWAWRGSRIVIGVSAGVVLVTVLASAVFLHAYRRVLDEAFQEKSAAYVLAFADAAHAWLARGDVDAARSAARFLLLGSALYVQIAADGAVVVDERTPSADRLALPAPNLSGGNRSLARGSGDGVPDYLDIVVPERDGAGYVRLGMDLSPVALRARSATLTAVGVAVAFDVALLASLVVVARRRPLSRGASGVGRGKLAEGQGVERGDPGGASPLTVDEERKEVRIRGRLISLTPKQYALLRLLSSSPGRVFSDKEILREVWPESGYADAKDVKQCVYLLRRRMGEEDPIGTNVVQNVPGFGYRLALPDDPELTEG